MCDSFEAPDCFPRHNAAGGDRANEGLRALDSDDHSSSAENTCVFYYIASLKHTPLIKGTCPKYKQAGYFENNLNIFTPHHPQVMNPASAYVD